MRFYMGVKDTIDPELFKKRAGRAARAVAAQAAQDMRPMVPARSGALRDSEKVDGIKISWHADYIGEVFSGSLQVDPKYGVGGFPLANGRYFSRRGVEKVPSGRQLHFAQGTSRWTYKAKELYVRKWWELARKELSHDK